jgi:hypothetical protein
MTQKVKVPLILMICCQTVVKAPIGEVSVFQTAPYKEFLQLFVPLQRQIIHTPILPPEPFKYFHSNSPHSSASVIPTTYFGQTSFFLKQ